MPTKIIDIHPHIVSEDTTRYPVAPFGGKRSDWSDERPVTFEHLIAAMDEAGVEKAAIVHSSTTYGFDNAYLADCVALQPKRFAGVFSVDMLAADAPEKIRYWVGRGLSGLRIFTGARSMEKRSAELDDPRFFPGWECADELGIPVVVSVRKDGLPQLMTLIKRFPCVKIIIDHMLKPPMEEGEPYAGCTYLFDLAKNGNVYLKLTTINVRASQKAEGAREAFFPRLVKEFGANRIAWGSNYPASQGTLPEMVSEAKTALSALRQEDQEWIFLRTAQCLYPTLADK
jgi:predicted TIM-barrel fold metal-dependent hydrolase